MCCCRSGNDTFAAKISHRNAQHGVPWENIHPSAAVVPGTTHFQPRQASRTHDKMWCATIDICQSTYLSHPLHPVSTLSYPRCPFPSTHSTMYLANVVSPFILSRLHIIVTCSPTLRLQSSTIIIDSSDVSSPPSSTILTWICFKF